MAVFKYWAEAKNELIFKIFLNWFSVQYTKSLFATIERSISFKVKRFFHINVGRSDAVNAP